MKANSFIVLLILQTIVSSLFAQTIRLNGSVMDAEKNAPIQNINIFLKDTRIGTVSNQKGDFSLSLPIIYENRYLYFTGIGYRKDSLLIRNIQSPVTVSLQPETYRLTEVYVMPDSTLLTLLRRAYSRIPENYPTSPTLYEAFYRESSQNTDHEQADFMEAILSIYKDPYNKPSNEPGQIEIVKSRKRQIHDVGIMYYGGPHTAINSDVVLKRAKFISPRHFKEYKYEFNGIKTLGDQEFYEVSYLKTSKDTAFALGIMLIEKESLAYVQFTHEGEILSHHPQIRKRTFTEKIIYEKEGDTWYFKYNTYKRDDYKRDGGMIYGSVDYMTTNIQTDSVKTIPYERRLQYLDIPVVKAEEYDPAGWTDYSILKNAVAGKSNFQFSETESADIFTQAQPTESKDILLKILPYALRFYYELGLSYKPVHISPADISMSFSPHAERAPFSIHRNQQKRMEYLLINSTFGYHLTKNWDVIYQVSGDLFYPEISSSEYRVGIGYHKNIKPSGRPLLVEASALFSFRNYYASLGKYDNPSTFSYKGTKIDASKISFWYGIQQKAVTPQLSLSSKLNDYLSLKLYVQYNWSVNNKDVFRIKEEKGGLFSKKKVTIPASDPGFSLPDHSLRPWDNMNISKWQFGIMLVLN